MTWGARPLYLPMNWKDYRVPDSEMLTPAEAAVVAEVSVREVNRVFDEALLPKRYLQGGQRRRLRSDACAFVRFYFHAAPKLTAAQRSRVIERVTARPDNAAPAPVEDEFLTVDLNDFVVQTEARRAALHRAREGVVQDPGILGGTPVIRGTRVPVHDIAAALAEGDSPGDIRADYSQLTDEQIEAAALYAAANPLRGRPRRGPWGDRLPVSEKRIRRHRVG